MARVEISPWEAGWLTSDLSGSTFARLIGTFELLRMTGRGGPAGHRRSAGAVERYPFHVRLIRFTRCGFSARPRMTVDSREIFRCQLI